MKIKIVKNLNSPLWDNFVDKSNNGTIFQKLQFLKYHKNNKFNFLNLAFYKKDKIIAVLPGGLINNSFTSPIGASYGSFVVNDISFQKYEEIIDVFLDFAQKENIKKIYLTPPPIIYLNKFNQIEEFILEYKGFKINNELITNAIDLKNFNQEDVIKNLTKNRRGDIYASQRKSLEIKLNNDYKSFFEMLIENKKKFKGHLTHSFDELQTLVKLFPKDIKLFMAYNKTQPISGLLLFITNKRTALVFYTCHYYKYQNFKGVSRLIYETIVWAKKNQYNWLDLGGSMNTLSDKFMEPSRSLIFFKETFGSKGFLRSTYSYEYP